MRNVYLITAFVVVLALSVLGLRGTKFTKSPMDVFPEWAFPGMKYQSKYQPQAGSAFFADGRSDRPLPPGVVPASFGPIGQPLRNDSARYEGKDAQGGFIARIPDSITVDLPLIQHGRDRYMIYCAPCHGALGDGQGITKQYGMGLTPSFHDERLREMGDGEIFNTISHGKGSMLSYADKLSPDSRWAVISYVRALQRTQQGATGDVPAARKPELGIK